jgi:hypothetical protein
MDIDTYDIYNLEYGDNILDTYYKINTYCDPAYVNIHNNGNITDFLNIIYNNVDIYNSSNFIKKMIQQEEEENQDEETEDLYEDYD